MSIQFTAALAWPLWAVVGLTALHASAQAPSLAPAADTATATATALRPRPDPADPAASVPVARYVSALRDYQGFADPSPTPWRELNDRVGQRGGWRAYAREPRASDASAP